MNLNPQKTHPVKTKASLIKRKGTKGTGRKKTKKSLGASSNQEKPVGPRSAYNFFYKHERCVVLNELSGRSTTEDENLWETSDRREKRRHRKTHGLIPLQQLTKIIAKRWKEASDETRRIFQDKSENDRARFKREMQQYNQNNKSTPASPESNDKGESKKRTSATVPGDAIPNTSMSITPPLSMTIHSGQCGDLFAPTPFDALVRMSHVPNGRDLIPASNSDRLSYVLDLMLRMKDEELINISLW